jgi:6,7-dimethyl-8-ribityllumazine synthase
MNVRAIIGQSEQNRDFATVILGTHIRGKTEPYNCVATNAVEPVSPGKSAKI